MIPFLNRAQKQKRKLIEHAAFAVKYARRMKEDQLDETTLSALKDQYASLRKRLKQKQYEGVEVAVEEALALAQKVHPAPRNAYGLRENVEVFVVVVAVALGLRTYFFQPYQIPTGSMQPTLYGITAKPDYEPTWQDKVPARWVKFALTGSRYKEIRAKASGIFPGLSEGSKSDTFYLVRIGGQQHKIHQDYRIQVRPGSPVNKGDLLARGLLKQGDHIIVNRIWTNFFRPKRGDITVFSTRGLPHVRANSAYIKRLTGLPGETISICNRHLLVNGEIVREPDVFVRQVEDPHYPGYSNPSVANYLRQGIDPLFPDCNSSLTLGDQEFLFMGDNTERSLDGRYFGSAPGRNIIGTAFFVPWPLFDRGIYGEHAGPVK